ncbi:MULTISPECIES: Na+/H+ antiporter subunit C [Corallincola]|uniref:Na+/H+ antiporter subunit C n=3 Tax=Corallincola TaxID=1775176 RepID=A0A368NNC9_9GAMM|nr:MULTISPECIES: Na+/H+ antiporter subunit C [Corallincola]RCU51918.1 Na+/H+ antiporter subunit C [Corallincola holothuriorum]TAA47409.1 Na+/H+ antiporter subunit C [Corallincola spongiicola]TCI05082.1 Na+/H+ antiporter subunit C [Corallincola luteus]
MEALYAACVGLMTTCGIFMMLRGHTFTLVMGLLMCSYAVNLFLFGSGGLTLDAPAILGQAKQHADPLPQALVLTAIVIGFAMTAFAVILAMRGRADLGNDHVDGEEPMDPLAKPSVPTQETK